MRSVEETLLQRFDKLSPSSSVAVRVLEVISNDDVGAADVAILIATDPVLTAKIMRMANSNLYAMSGKISQLNVAIALLGLTTVQSIALTSALQIVSPIEENDWKHSLITAIAATLVASKFGADIGEAFSVGMLHDLGASVFREYDKSGYLEIMSSVDDPLSPDGEDSLLSLEFERYGTTHPTLGAAIMRSWSLPPEMQDAVRSHHSHKSTSALSKTLRVADYLAYHAQNGQDLSAPIFAEISLDEGLVLLEQLKEQADQSIAMII